MKLVIISLVAILCLSVHSGNRSAAQEAIDVWATITAALEASPLTDLVFIIGNADGELYVYGKGLGYPDIPGVQIASSSKWWTSVLLITLVEQGVMSLDNHPQDYIDWWTNDPNDRRSQITLAHLLSMTAGFRSEPVCEFDPFTTMDACVQVMYEQHHFDVPGTVFNYNSSHMQVAGLMAQEATGETIVDLFRTAIGDPLGMQETTNFWRASEQNSWMAGGGNSSPRDYARFLQAIMAGELVADSLPIMMEDRTADPVRITASPIAAVFEWHYGLGMWKECLQRTWTADCDESQVYSSPGGLGWYPWIDFENGYYAVLARQDFGTRGNALLLSGELALQLRPLILRALQASR
jgi:CubicO group peptidase (beta-lactamase class C family)